MEMLTPTSDPQTLDIAAQVATFAETAEAEAEAFVVSDLVSHAEAARRLLRVRAMRDAWSAYKEPQIEAAMEAKRAAEKARKVQVDDKDRLDGPLLKAEKIYGEKTGAFEEVQERKRLEEQARIQQQAEQEADTRALAVAAELEEAALVAPTREEAQALEAEAEAIVDEAIEHKPVVQLPSFTPKIAGLSRPEEWITERLDLDMLLTALVAKKLDKALEVLKRELWPRITSAVLPPINQRVRALKEAVNIPGVTAGKKKGMRLR